MVYVRWSREKYCPYYFAGVLMGVVVGMYVHRHIQGSDFQAGKNHLYTRGDLGSSPTRRPPPYWIMLVLVGIFAS